MKRFACGDVVPGCDATFLCSTEDEMLSTVARHGAEVHGLTALPAALVDKVRSHIVLVS